jgi:hypothetical protein
MYHVEGGLGGPRRILPCPQGVNCTVPQFLDGSCMESLETYIAQTGGSYTAR